MEVHVFASYGTDMYLVAANSEAEAKGMMWDEDTVSNVEYVGTVDEVLGGDDVTRVTP